MQSQNTTNTRFRIHHLTGGATLTVTASSWTKALEQMWPEPWCIILRGPGEDFPYLSARLSQDGRTMCYVAGTSPDDAKEGAREDYQAYMRAHPEEVPARHLGVVRKRLMADFLNKVAPWLDEKERGRIIRRLETMPRPHTKARREVLSC